MRRSKPEPARLLAVVAATAVLVGLSAPAGAGGTWLEPTKESYDPGEEVEAVAYVGASVPEQDDAFIARLDLVLLADAPQAVDEEGNRTRSDWHELGPVTVEPTRLGGYLNSRVSIRFQVPAGLEPGRYEVAVRDASGGFLGDLIGMILHVGIQPEFLTYGWPLDEPLISELPDEAIIAGPGFSVPVGDLRAGRYPAGAEEFMLHPGSLPENATRSPERAEGPRPRVVRGHHLSGVPAPAEGQEAVGAGEASPALAVPAPSPPVEQPDPESPAVWVAAVVIVVVLIIGSWARASGWRGRADAAALDQSLLQERDETLVSATPSPGP